MPTYLERKTTMKISKEDLRYLVLESVRQFLNEEKTGRTRYWVSDDGGYYNAFSDDMFDERGRYIENPNYTIDDFDIVRYFNTFDEACDYAERMNDGYGEDDGDSLYESRQGLKSKKLYDIINQYGLPMNHLHPKSIFGISDFHNMTDADVIGAVPYEKVHAKNQKELNGLAVKNGFSLSPADMVEVIELNNGMALLVINRNGNFDRTSYQQEGGFKDLRKKQSERDSRRSGNGSRQYQWKSPTADETFHNPYFKKWSLQSRKKQMDKIRKDYQK